MKEHPYDPEALQELFALEPDNDLNPVQMMRRSLFPRWEIIRPTAFDPVQAENQRLEQLIDLVEQEPKNDDHPGH